jgi:hypothetical protein
MTSIHLNLHDYHTLPALVGGFIIVFGLVSLFIKERLFISDTRKYLFIL